MFKNKQQGIIYLDRNTFDYYSSGQNNTLRFDFSSFITSLEINNKEGLEGQIKLFIDNNKLAPSNIAIILSENILFIKGFPAETENVVTEIQKFSDNVPFEHVSIKHYGLDNGILAVATNKDLYSVIKEVFEKNGFVVEAIVPIFNTGINTLDPNYGLDPASAKSLMGNFDTLKQNTFEVEEEQKIPKPPPTVSQKKENKKTYMLLAVLGILIIILVFVSINALKPTPKKLTNKTLPATNSSPAPNPSIVNDEKTGTISATLTEATAKIEIVAPLQNPIIAENLKSKLTTLGFQNIEIEKNTTIISQSTIVFSSSLPINLREKLLKEVSTLYPNITMQQEDSPHYDAVIRLQK